MKKIEKLTKKQTELMAVVRDEWINKLGNLVLNKEDVEEGIEFLYSSINKPKIIYVKSPLGLQYAYHLLNILNSVGASVLDSVVASVWASVLDSVWASVGDSVRDSVRDSVWYSVWASVGDSVGYSVRDSVGDSVRASVGASVRDSVWASVGDSVGASVGYSVRDAVLYSVGKSKIKFQTMGLRGSVYDWDWNAWIDFYQRIGLKHRKEKEVQKLFKLQSAYDFLLYKNVAIVSEHPIKTPARNSEGRLHCDGGPAVEFADGFKVWALNGVRVPQYLAETPAGNLDLEFLKKEKNADIKAQFIKKYGIERLTEFGEIIDS